MSSGTNFLAGYGFIFGDATRCISTHDQATPGYAKYGFLVYDLLRDVSYIGFIF